MNLSDAFAAVMFGARPQPTAAEIDEREAAALAEIERRSPSPKHVIHTHTTEPIGKVINEIF